MANAFKLAQDLKKQDDLRNKVLALKNQGKRVEAIKLYRIAKSCDLKTAMDAVERMY